MKLLLCCCVVHQDDPELPFTDELFWRRKAHPNFKPHIDLEKRVVKLGKSVRLKSHKSDNIHKETPGNPYSPFPFLCAVPSEQGAVLHIRGGIRSSVWDGRADPALLFQGRI